MVKQVTTLVRIFWLTNGMYIIGMVDLNDDLEILVSYEDDPNPFLFIRNPLRLATAVDPITNQIQTNFFALEAFSDSNEDLFLLKDKIVTARNPKPEIRKRYLHLTKAIEEELKKGDSRPDAGIQSLHFENKKDYEDFVNLMKSQAFPKVQ